MIRMRPARSVTIMRPSGSSSSPHGVSSPRATVSTCNAPCCAGGFGECIAGPVGLVALPQAIVCPTTATHNTRALRIDLEGLPCEFPAMLLQPYAAAAGAFLLVATTAVDPSLRVTTTTAAIRLDGRLDEQVWRTADSVADFAQVEPAEHAPASARTVVQALVTSDAL